MSATTPLGYAQLLDWLLSFRTKDGNVVGITVLGVARTSSVKARTQAMNQLRRLVSTAPAELRERLRALPIKQIVEVCAGLQPGLGQQRRDDHQDGAAGAGPSRAVPRR